MIKTLDDKKPKRVFGLMAGMAGVGKTTQATFLPKKETLIISVEDGLLSIAGSGFACEEVTSYDELLNIIEAPPKWVKYLYIDSLSEIYDLLKKELDGKYTKSQNFGKHEEMTLKLFHLIRTARKLSIDVIFTCHVKQEKNGLSMEDELSFDGKMPTDLKKQFDLVVQLKSDEDENGKLKRVFITSPELSKIAKARVSPWLGIEINDIEEANIYKLIKKLKGEK